MKLKTDITNFDPIILNEKNEKVAVLLRNHNKIGYIVGICFELKDYEPIEVNCLQEGVATVIGLLKRIGVVASV